jgi:hypothetical protein
VEPPVAATDGVLERGRLQDVSWLETLAHEIDHQLAGGFRDCRLGRVGRRDAVAAHGRQAQELTHASHGIGRELTTTGTRAGTRLVLQGAALLSGDAAGGFRADGLEDVLNRDVFIGVVPRRNRTPVEHQTRHIHAGQRHGSAGNGLVAADERDNAVELVAVDHHLDGISNQLAADE